MEESKMVETLQEMLNNLSHQRNANQKNSEIPSYTCKIGQDQKHVFTLFSFCWFLCFVLLMFVFLFVLSSFISIHFIIILQIPDCFLRRDRVWIGWEGRSDLGEIGGGEASIRILKVLYSKIYIKNIERFMKNIFNKRK